MVVVVVVVVGVGSVGLELVACELATEEESFSSAEKPTQIIKRWAGLPRSHTRAKRVSKWERQGDGAGAGMKPN